MLDKTYLKRIRFTKYANQLDLKIAVFHGNEIWVLRGLAIDIEKSLKRIGVEVSRHEVNLNSPGAIPEADWFLFVQQGQLDAILGAWGYRKDLVKKSICIFTHFVAKKCNFELLSKIKLISHMSSHQMAISIGNGLSQENSKLMILGVDMERHYPITQDYLTNILNDLYPNIKIKQKKSYIGFCTRITNKSTYTNRKNYECLLKVINKLVSSGENVLVIGDGWQNVKLAQRRDNLVIANPPYKHYNYFYNLMRLFVSVTSYDGGPIPLLESMACGVPAVITNSGFAPDIIKNKNAGTIFQPFASEFEVLNLIKESDKINYNREYLRRISSKYSFDEYAKKLINILS